jgi:diguanylate cyclase (GGDEF) domain
LLSTQERLRKFNDFIKKIQGEINEEDIYHDALIFLKQNVKANQILIKNIDFDSQRVNIVTSLKPVGDVFIESKEVTHNPSLCYIIRENKPFTVKDINEDYTCRYHIYPQKSGGYICVPISFNSRVQGLIHIFNLEKDYFTDEVVNFVVDVANTISSYIMALKVYKEAHFYATVDPLTEAFNRRFAESFLEKEIARAGRNKAIFSILMFDLDNFKDINDKYGHKIGDITLKMFVNFLKESLRSCDVISRFGGDEFMVILPDTDAGGAKSIIKKIKDELKNKKFILEDDAIINLSTSMGFATYLEDGKTIDDLYLKGDKRLYKMKKSIHSKLLAGR